MQTPALNITMPVFNRFELTQKSLLSLRRCSQTVPFSITVVDNGSDGELVERLIEFKQAGIVDKLFLLQKNVGIAAAANIGWEMTNAPFYLKIDNDVIVTDKDFFTKIFKLWAHGEGMSTLGGTTGEMLEQNPGAVHTEDGILGLCTNTLAGEAIFIPKHVSDILGFWSEDYGLFGEDADYGNRMHCAGFKQYYYCRDGMLTNLGNDSAQTYSARNLDKTSEKRAVVTERNGDFGLFMINQCLYNLCIRTWKPVRRYKVIDVGADCRVTLGENKEFSEYKALLDQCAQKINERVRKLALPNPDHIFDHEFIEELKRIMNSGGYGCESPD